MIEGPSQSQPVIQVGWAGKALAEKGEGMESGDLHVLVPFEGGALIAVIDGLGHGTEARAAARAAVEVLEAHPGQPVRALVELCHERLRKTRGAVMSLASFSCGDSSVTWVGVGNVEGTLFRAHHSTERRRESITIRAGVVGYQLPPLRADSYPVARGDTLILRTDGIRTGFTAGLALERSPQEIAEWILAGHDKLTDDALVVVARYLGRDEVTDVLESPTLRVLIREESDVAIARIRSREIAREQGMEETDTEALATAVSEVAHNILAHAGRGEIAVGAIDESGRRALVVVAHDRGPGISSAEQALQDGFTTGRGLGLGLSGARRLVDEFELRSRPDGGTIIAMKKWAT